MNVINVHGEKVKIANCMIQSGHFACHCARYTETNFAILATLWYCNHHGCTKCHICV